MNKILNGSIGSDYRYSAQEDKNNKQNNQNHNNILDYFGISLFSDSAQSEYLPTEIYKKLKDTIKNNATLDASIANQVANAMKNWAITKGATHYTHWFQPLSGATAEKHDSFLSISEDGNPILEFSGKQLIQGEPDASSFPSGGIRQTFEARGYTAWDPTSPAFILESDFGKTLFIPTAFFSYSGEALDMKTPLLRSQECLSNSAVKVLELLGRKVNKVYTTAGLEQEFFLIDSEIYKARPDLVATGRTLFGNAPFKGQELSDHYFGSINQRVINYLQDCEKKLYELGIPIKTRHNEVAPRQYEIAPVFEKSNLAVDHNLIIMTVMKIIASKHGFKFIAHEKPFKGVNGSGKHCNWSMSDSEGRNLLDPGNTPAQNLEFMIFLAAVVRAIDLWAPLMRISVASSGNDHRLGQHEAPPAILSVFLGDSLNKIINDLADHKSSNPDKTEKQLKLGVSVLPNLPKDNSDRNRTCPFAFTGNKFEFRALGSKQNGSAPNYTLNTTVADSLDFIYDKLSAELNKGNKLVSAVENVVSQIFRDHKRVIFNGDGYSEDWLKEAKKRGLPNLKTLVDAVVFYDTPESIKLFEKYKVMNKREIIARKNVRLERYLTETMIEVRTMLSISKNIILPASLKHQKIISDAVNSIKILKEISDLSYETQLDSFIKFKNLVDDLIKAIEVLQKKYNHQNDDMAIIKKARYAVDELIPAMNSLREVADQLEELVDDELWKLPKYSEILSS